MKKLLRSTTPPTRITVVETDTDTKSTIDENKYRFDSRDLVDILSQIEELKNYNIAIRNDDGTLLLGIGDSIYEIDETMDKRYPRRRLRKREN